MERPAGLRCIQVVRVAITVLLAFSVSCAAAPSTEPPGGAASTVVVRLDRNDDSGSWPTARAELGDQRVAFCPVSIEMGGGSDTISCGYTVGPLRVPQNFGIVVRGDATDATFSTTPTTITLEVVVRDGEGTVVAIDGETFEMGGGFTVEFRPRDKVEPRDVQLLRLEDWLGYSIPERCLGPDVYGVWIVGET